MPALTPAQVENHRRDRSLLHASDAESELLSAAAAAERRAAASDPDGHAAASAELQKAEAAVAKANAKLEARRRDISALENQIVAHGRLRVTLRRFDESFPPVAIDSLGARAMDAFMDSITNPCPQSEGAYVRAAETLIWRRALAAFVGPKREKLNAEVEASKAAIQARAKALKVDIGNLIHVMQADCFATTQDAVGQFRCIKPEVHSIIANGACSDLLE